MAYSYEVTVSTGSTPNVTVPFLYIQKADVHVKLDGVLVPDDDLVWSSDQIIELPATPNAGTVVRVYRVTDASKLSTEYSTPAVLDHRDWNRVLLQLLYVTQEAFDANEMTAGQLEDVLSYINDAVDAAAASAANAHQSEVNAADHESGAGVSAGNAAASASSAAASLSAVNAKVDGFDDHVDVETGSAISAINAEETSALSAISAARNTAVSDVEDAVVPAEAARDLAKEWAENPEDDDVTGYPGEYSARHWAAKAAALAAGSASNISFTPAGNVEATNVQAAIEEVDAALDGLAYGLGDASSRDVATASELTSDSGSDLIPVDVLWDATEWKAQSGSGTINVDCAGGCNFEVTLTGNATINLQNAKSGQPINLVVKQDGSGGRTIAWGASFLFANGVTPTIRTTANSYAAAVSGIWHGTNLLCSGWRPGA